MKNKYISGPAELLMLEIVLVVVKIKDSQKLKEYLRTKIGMNDAQIAFVTDRSNDEEIKDSEAFRNKMLELQPEQPYRKIDDDFRFIRKGMRSNVAVTLLFILMTAAVVYLGWFDTEGRDPGNILMLRFVAPWILLGTTFYAFQLEFIYTRLYFRMKDDLRCTTRKDTILSNIVKVLPIKSTENRGVTVGLVIFNRESDKTVRYYLFARDIWIDQKIDRQALCDQKPRIVYLEKSRLIVNDDYRKIVKMALRKGE